MSHASRQCFNDLTIEEQEQLRERLATHDFGDLTPEEQALIRDRLRHEPFCGYPSQIWIGQGGPIRKGDLEPPIFSTPPAATRQPKRGFIAWLRGCFEQEIHQPQR